jgi:hypothetical protein
MPVLTNPKGELGTQLYDMVAMGVGAWLGGGEK